MKHSMAHSIVETATLHSATNPGTTFKVLTSYTIRMANVRRWQVTQGRYRMRYQQQQEQQQALKMVRLHPEQAIKAALSMAQVSSLVHRSHGDRRTA